MRARDGEGIIPVLAKTVRQVEANAQRGKVRPRERTAYQVVAILLREERTRVRADSSIPESERTAMMTRLDGIATILAKTAARDTSIRTTRSPTDWSCWPRVQPSRPQPWS